jgi:hypothetical protein
LLLWASPTSLVTQRQKAAALVLKEHWGVVIADLNSASDGIAKEDWNTIAERFVDQVAPHNWEEGRGRAFAFALMRRRGWRATNIRNHGRVWVFKGEG